MSGSTTRLEGATRRASGGGATTSTARADVSMTLHPDHALKTPPARSGSAAFPSDNVAARGAADWLSLAAAPTFAIMALLTAVTGDADMVCTAAEDASPLSGMVIMYLLMSAFHLAPWLKLVASRRSAAHRS
ncbi:MAG: hypothetical protein EOR10_06890 [Mesorhizobium sp.]|nr:MAG: hypothetical protein EOR10_06890 [Mesorhizobium sp.]